MESNNQTLRFKDAAWFPRDRAIQVQIGGAGGIGSWLAFFLSRIGYAVAQYDFDTVEEHNLGGQLFAAGHIGNTKVHAVHSVVNRYSGNIMYSGFNERITDGTPAFLICFSAFDNMLARTTMFNNWLKAVKDYNEAENYEEEVIPIFIDGRLEAEQLQIFTCVYSPQEDVFNENVTRYTDTLFLDVEGADEPPCTMKQTSHTAALIASKMTCIFTNHVANSFMGEKLRSVPYRYEEFTPGFIIQNYE
jgi:hypothetical protein